jgi:excisionase family DNA binding protein
MAEDEVIMSVVEAAPLVALSARGIYRAIAAGHIPPGVYFRIGRDIYIRRSALLAWRDAGGTAAT